MLRVSSLATGLSTIVRINDRGPAASTGRALDLSRGAAINLGIAARGESQVAIEIVH
jgi:rare lipoprotein A